MIDFLFRVLDSGDVIITKLAPGSLRTHIDDLDASFVPVYLKVNDRIDLHVDLSDGFMARPLRMVSVSLFDDKVPSFDSPEEADAWMAARARR